MRGRGDDHGRLASDEALGEKGGGAGKQPIVGGVELHGMIRAAVARMRHQFLRIAPAARVWPRQIGTRSGCTITACAPPHASYWSSS